MCSAHCKGDCLCDGAINSTHFLYSYSLKKKKNWFNHACSCAIKGREVAYKLSIKSGTKPYFLNYPLYGFCPALYSSLSSFLSGRSISAVEDGHCFISKPINSGILQGSVLSPTLFLLFINNLSVFLGRGMGTPVWEQASGYGYGSFHDTVLSTPMPTTPLFTTSHPLTYDQIYRN